jgi:hypothetical protein
VYLCVIVVYYDTEELEDTLDLRLYSIDNEEEYYSSIPIEEGVVGSMEEPQVLIFKDPSTPES